MELIIRPTHGKLAETHPYHIYNLMREEHHSFYTSEESAIAALDKFQPKKEVSIADPR